MNKPKQPLCFAVPFGGGTIVFAVRSFTQAVETKNKLQAEYNETSDRDVVLAMHEITSEEFDGCLVHEATAARILDNSLVCFVYPVPHVEIGPNL